MWSTRRPRLRLDAASAYLRQTVILRGAVVKSSPRFQKTLSCGNVVDLAVGVVIGTAFSDLVKSMVTHVITPLIAFIVSLAGGRMARPSSPPSRFLTRRSRSGAFLNS